MLHLAQENKADELLSANPLALVIGLVLDQQVPIEWAFRAPLELHNRLGDDLDACRLAALGPDKLVELFVQKPALHRYPAVMARRVHALCSKIAAELDGDPSEIWKEASSGPELLTALKRLPGFGEQKARIFVALLGKQLGVRPLGWEKACEPYGQAGSLRSVADIVDAASLVKVREHKRAMKAAAHGAR
ncbi:MAG: HhH-GPD-type base excision DNA repair protein [Acidimicrobiales bacterium]